MTLVAAVVAGVAAIALVAAIVAWRSAAKRLVEADTRAAAGEEALKHAVESAEELSNDLAEVRRRANQADHKVEEAEKRSAAADTRASAAEAELASLRSAGSPAVLAEVERVRLEREWSEVAGPGAAFPVVWDGSVSAALAIELEIIREVTGTPSRLEPEAVERAGTAAVAAVAMAAVGVAEQAHGAADGEAGWVLAGLGFELLRLVARHADELVVRLEGRPNPHAIMAEALRATTLGDLGSIEAAAKGAGLTLSLGQTAEGLVVWLTSEIEQERRGPPAES